MLHVFQEKINTEHQNVHTLVCRPLFIHLRELISWLILCLGVATNNLGTDHTPVTSSIAIRLRSDCVALWLRCLCRVSVSQFISLHVCHFPPFLLDVFRRTAACSAESWCDSSSLYCGNIQMISSTWLEINRFQTCGGRFLPAHPKIAAPHFSATSALEIEFFRLCKFSIKGFSASSLGIGSSPSGSGLCSCAFHDSPLINLWCPKCNLDFCHFAFACVLSHVLRIHKLTAATTDFCLGGIGK